jgi:putative ABC transport system permease protein
MAVVNLIFVAIATAIDARAALAITRALGASPNEVTMGVALAQIASAVLGALVGLPLGVALFSALSPSNNVSAPPWWSLTGLVPATALLAAILTALPARISSRQPVAGILQAEHP